jgi:type II secretory pathway pseudopilin PulG
VKTRRFGFSLVEVVLALGVVSFAIVAILGLIPTGLQTSHSSQDETRASQIAQSILVTFSGQQFNAVTFLEYDASDGSQSGSIAFDLSSQNGSGPTWGANNSGELFVPGTPIRFLTRPSGPPATAADTGQTYSVTISFNNALTGFDAQYANELVVSVAWPANAAPANQTRRDFVRIVSRY